MYWHLGSTYQSINNSLTKVNHKKCFFNRKIMINPLVLILLHEHSAHIFWGRWRPFFTLARSQKPMMIRFLTRCEGSHRGQTLGSALACTVENMCSKWLLAHSSPRASSQWGLWPLNEKRSLKKLTDSAFILRLQECTFDVENCFFVEVGKAWGSKTTKGGIK